MSLIKILWVAITCLGSYLLGSVPFSVWIGNLVSGKDLRKHGVRNPGGLNAVMTFGPLIGGLILFLDYFKGTITIALIDHLFSLEYFYAPDGTNIWYTLTLILGPFCCILGHNYSVWLKFDGGQGLGVYMGTVFYLNPLVILFHNVFIIGIMLTGKVNVRVGTFVGILIEMMMIMFIPLFPPWTNILANSFPWAPAFLHVKAMIVIFAMALALLIKVIQSIRSKHKSASWTVGKDGEQQFSQN